MVLSALELILQDQAQHNTDDADDQRTEKDRPETIEGDGDPESVSN